MIEKLHEKHIALIQNHPLCAGKKLVRGEGNSRSPLIMMIGEAPGAQEEQQGRPFVGKAGQNLDEFLRVMGVERASIYITNVVKYRPTAMGRIGLINRAPNEEEIRLFVPWLSEEIDFVKPQWLVTLGNTPLKTLVGNERTVGALHGRPIKTKNGFILYPLYHPAAIIYKQDLKPVYQADVERLKDLILRQSADR